MSLINQYFSTDHRRLDCLLEAFISHLNLNEDTGYRFFKLFYDDLVKHIEWEERILFPIIENAIPMSKGPTSVMCREHEQIKAMLAIIDEKLKQGSNDIEQEITQLSDILSAHNMKEENVLYPMIDSNISEAQLAQIFCEMK